jgi:hypothetical protein
MSQNANQERRGKMIAIHAFAPIQVRLTRKIDCEVVEMQIDSNSRHCRVYVERLP